MKKIILISLVLLIFIIPISSAVYKKTWTNARYDDSFLLDQTFNSSNITNLYANFTSVSDKDNNVPINTSGLVLRLDFENNLTDLSINGNNGTNYGANWTGGYYGNALSFDGVNDYVEILDSPSLDIGTNSFTFEAWIRRSSSNVGTIIFKSDCLSARRGYRLFINSSNLFIMSLNDGNYADYYLFNASNTIGSWSHFAVSTDRINAYAYLNGELKNIVDISSSSGDLSNSYSFIIGSYRCVNSYSTFFNGIIDEIRIYNRSLNANEIKQNYLQRAKELRIKSNSNITYSSNWNDTSDNPINIPYGDNELINSFQVNQSKAKKNMEFNLTIRIETAEGNSAQSSITNLQSTSGLTWINWTWNNPSDPDFNYTMIYLNGIWKVNTSIEYYNATGLIPDTSYTISTRTVDNNGNISTMWNNDTTSTSMLVLISPIEITKEITDKSISLYFTINNKSIDTLTLYENNILVLNNSSSNYYINNNIKTNQRYRYKLYAYNNSTLIYSNIFDIDTPQLSDFETFLILTIFIISFAFLGYFSKNPLPYLIIFIFGLIGTFLIEGSWNSWMKLGFALISVIFIFQFGLILWKD